MSFRATWFTNLPAPYRLKIFEALSRRCDLHVNYLAARAEDRDWDLVSSTTYESRLLRTFRFPGFRGERELRIAAQRLGPLVASADVVALGSWESPAYWHAFLSSSRASKPVTVFYESTLDTNRYSLSHPVGRVRKALLGRASSVLTSGTSSTEAVLSMGVDPDRIVTGFNTVDVRAFHQKAEMARQNHPMPHTADAHVYLFAGRPLARKNLLALLQAFAAVRRADDRLIVVGPEPDSMNTELSASNLGSTEVEFLGHVPSSQMPEVYARANTLVMPSISEVWGMVVNEALASGLHVVTTTTAGVTASVRSMRGVYAANPTASDLAAAMEQSRARWGGRIEAPEILEFTPERSASDYERALRLAMDLG